MRVQREFSLLFFKCSKGFFEARYFVETIEYIGLIA